MTKKQELKANLEQVPIVCIGASAGGLEAIERFFQNCPEDLGVAYVVIQHLSSHYKSMMDDLINRYSSMPVSMIKAEMKLQPNHIYLIEAGTTVTLQSGHFAVKQKFDKEFTLPIDIFLESLAKQAETKSVAVILSGTGSDCSRGAMAINESGGFVIAQTPREASFDGMPQSVISTGIVDHILDAATIPGTIAKYLSADINIQNSLKVSSFNNETYSSIEEQLPRIISTLLKEFAINFGFYKEATVFRRIERRMQVKHISDFARYADLIEKDVVEASALRRELLIPVTNFFRDHEIFEHISEVVLKDIVSKHREGEIRVWVAGCSSGEEAYSYAILLEEKLRQLQHRFDFKIFATDVNPEIIEIASKGIYPESSVKEIPKHLVDKYFKRQDGHIVIAPEIRSKVVFAVHNLLADAPFTKMDIVSCRNTLIYFKNEAQKEALQRLQFAVKPNGYLVLGKSESVSVNSEYFLPTDRAYKIYQCQKRTPVSVDALKYSKFPNHAHRPPHNSRNTFTAEGQIEYLAEHQIKTEFMPLSLLVNEHHDVVHIFGDGTNLLRLKPGNLNYQVSNLLPDKLSPVAVALLYRLHKENKPLSADCVELIDGDTKRMIKLKGWVINNPNLPLHYVLAFNEITDYIKTNNDSESIDLTQATLDKIQQLESELTATRESLQSTIEELETTNEELQATNEELMASNEELQSSNEELQSVNEELQSVNEELNTVNAEYHEKMSILNRINADLDAMSLSTGIATIFVDDMQNLTRFTPDATMIFKVREQDLGRPISDIVNNLQYNALFEDIEQTLRTGRAREVEVLGQHGQGYLMRIVSYKLPSSDNFGAAISLIESKSFGSYQKVLDSLPEHIAVLDENGEILLVNESWKRFAVVNSEIESCQNYWLGSNYLNVCDEEVGKGISDILTGKVDRFSMKYPCHSPTEKRWYAMEARPIKHVLYKAVVTHFNVTQWEQRE